jgi:hypothetical protein
MTGKKRLLAITTVAILIVCIVVIWGFIVRPHLEEERQVKRMKDDVALHLHAGADAGIIVPFFVERGWDYAHDRPTGTYSVALRIRKGSWESRWLKIHIVIQGGRIKNLSATDFFETL